MLVIYYFIIYRIIINNFLKTTSIHSTDQKLEWAYCFDVHCNSFVPFFLLTYIIQFLFLPILNSEGYVPALLSNLLYLSAITMYWYITFLGYNALPFVVNSHYFLSPILFMGFIMIVFILFGFNPSVYILRDYFN
jgi:hypothetical protein